jgi:uncharacterized peroxidase-related enzyme
MGDGRPTTPSSPHFLSEARDTAEARRLYDDDVADLGYVMNLTRLWAYQPETNVALFDLLKTANQGVRLSVRQRGILITAAASTLGDAYCSLAWGSKLATECDADTSAGVLRGDDDHLSESERAMARWARRVAGDPTTTGQADIDTLRDVGFSDDEIFAMTVFVALRIAFSTVNNALGAPPDAAYRSTAPGQVLEAVGFGRPIADT